MALRERPEVRELLADDLLWGAAEIAKFIGKDRQQVYHLLRLNAIPHRKLSARTIIARKSELRSHMRQQDDDGARARFEQPDT
jgi:hypothetical protein